MSTMTDCQDDVGSWHRATFPTAKSAAIIAKFEEEAAEFVNAAFGEDEHADRKEAADVVITLLAYADHMGFNLFEQVAHKMAVNRARDWSKAPESGGQYRHVG